MSSPPARFVLAILVLSAGSAFAAGPVEPNDPLAGLEARLLGPAAGGRVSRVTGVPGDATTWYAATAAGGVWKSTNGGLDWSPIFDDQPVSSTGSVAVAPSDPNVIWVGTGEANIRGNVAEGNGVYRSNDAGKTWTHVLALEGQIGTMAVDPRDADRAFAAVLGSPFGPGPDRGVYRTTDGGATWKKVLFVDEQTGASDVAIDPNNPRVVFAGTWPARRYPWGMESGGPGGGLWVSRDGGDSWTRLGADEGLPEGIRGKVGVRVAPSDSRRVYALIEAEDGGLFRSDDGGESWRLVNGSRGLRQRAWYYTTLTVDPTDSDTVWFPQVAMLKTTDGGKTIEAVAGGGWDYHDVWIDPTAPHRIAVGSDAGVSLSADAGATWRRPPMAIAQLYHLTTDSREPYRVLASLQDFGTASGPSHSLHHGGVFLSDWHSVGGGEAGHVVAETDDPGVVWAGEYLGIITRWDETTGRAPHKGIYPESGSGKGAGDLRYRFQWTAPIAVSPHDPKTIYHGANVLFRTRDAGQTWQAISPDLTRNDPEKQRWAGGPITGDNTGVEYYDTIFAVTESPVTRGLLWVGSDDGLVHVSRDDGATWANVTPKGMPEWATVRVIEASRRDPGTAWLVADNHRLDDETPYLWKTTDYGATWSSLAKGLDRETYLHVVREDPEVSGILYLGTERGLRISRDGGASWSPLDLGLPTVAVVDLAVKDDDLVIGTLGRSIWIFDDLTPIREWRPAIADEPLHLFAPRDTVAWHLAGPPLGGTGAGENPPPGVLVTYFLKEEPGDEIRLEVLDQDGRVVRTLSSTPIEYPIGPGHPDWPPGYEVEPELSTKPGLQRAHWDLTWDGAPYIPQSLIDTGDPGVGPEALPGTYTVRLVVGERRAEAPVTVLADPRSTTSPADREAQLAFLLGLRDDMTGIAERIATIRSLREQLAARGEALAAAGGHDDLVARGEALSAKLAAIEETLHNPHAEVTYDILAGRHGGVQLVSRYGWLFEMGREHEGPPTQGMREVEAGLDEELAKQAAALDALLAEEVPALEAAAREAGVGYVVMP